MFLAAFPARAFFFSAACKMHLRACSGRCEDVCARAWSWARLGKRVIEASRAQCAGWCGGGRAARALVEWQVGGIGAYKAKSWDLGVVRLRYAGGAGRREGGCPLGLRRRRRAMDLMLRARGCQPWRRTRIILLPPPRARRIGRWFGLAFKPRGFTPGVACARGIPFASRSPNCTQCARRAPRRATSIVCL